MFERIIRIVHLLRNQNNYIALMSGMTALSDVWMGRLAATKELAMEMLEKSGDGAVFKKFQSHFRLVENRQNYKNYRLAVKEDETAKRTAIPLMSVFPCSLGKLRGTDAPFEPLAGPSSSPTSTVSLSPRTYASPTAPSPGQSSTSSVRSSSPWPNCRLEAAPCLRATTPISLKLC